MAKKKGKIVKIIINAISPKATYEFLRRNRRKIAELIHGDMRQHGGLKPTEVPFKLAKGETTIKMEDLMKNNDEEGKKT